MLQDTMQSSIDQLCLEYSKAFEGNEIVFGRGRASSSLIIVGEAPGKDEVKLGRPFVGAAGKNLDEFINVLGIDREELYITNAIKYRLGRLNPKTKRTINRPATVKEIRENQIWLYKEIQLICPRIIVTLGNVPLKAVVDDFNVSVGDMHGHLHDCRIFDKQYKLFPLYHPASIIYNRSLKDTYFIDMINLKKETLEILK